jgi:hypothetical protein
MPGLSGITGPSECHWPPNCQPAFDGQSGLRGENYCNPDCGPVIMGQSSGLRGESKCHSDNCDSEWSGNPRLRSEDTRDCDDNCKWNNDEQRRMGPENNRGCYEHNDNCKWNHEKGDSRRDFTSDSKRGYDNDKRDCRDHHNTCKSDNHHGKYERGGKHSYNDGGKHGYKHDDRDCHKPGHDSDDADDADEADEADEVDEAPAAPVVMPAQAAPQHVAQVSSSQPKALAFTGADVSLPLTLGLVALGLGTALSLAGRRRGRTTV